MNAETKSSTESKDGVVAGAATKSAQERVTVGRWHGKTYRWTNTRGEVLNVVLVGEDADELAREAAEEPVGEEPPPEMPNFMELMWLMLNPFRVKVRVSDKAYLTYLSLVACCGDFRNVKADEHGEYWLELNPWPNRSGRRFTPTLQELADFLPGRPKPFESPLDEPGSRKAGTWIPAGANERTVRLVLDELEEHRLVTREIVGRFKDGKRSGTALRIRVQIPRNVVEAASLGRPKRQSWTSESGLNSASPDRNSASRDRKSTSGCSTSRQEKTLKTLSVGDSQELEVPVAADAAEEPALTEPSGRPFTDAELRQAVQAAEPSDEAVRQAIRRPEAAGGKDAVHEACQKWAVATWRRQNPSMSNAMPTEQELMPLMRWLTEPLAAVATGSRPAASGASESRSSLVAYLVTFGIEEPNRTAVMRRKSEDEIRECVRRCKAAGLGPGYLVAWSEDRKPLPSDKRKSQSLRLSGR